MTATIAKSDILDKVKANIGVFARDAVDSSGDSIYDALKMEERDEKAVELMYNDGVGMALSAVGEYASKLENGSLEITQPSRCNDTQFADVSKMVVLAVVNRVTALWFELKYPEKSSQFNEAAKKACDEIWLKLHTKSEPVRKSYGN